MSWIFRKLGSAFRRLSLPYVSAASQQKLQIQYPVLVPLKELHDKIRRASENKYRMYRLLKELDTELYGAIDRVAKMVRYAYQGFVVHAGKKLEPKEQKLLQLAQEFDRKWDLKTWFYTAAEQLVTNGDFICEVQFNDDGLQLWRPLPIEALTIIESEDQLSDVTAQVFEPNIYVLNEMNQENRKMWPRDQIWHVSLNRHAQPVYDLLGRYTFGVWSLSPLEPLKWKLLWKVSIEINDIMMRQRLVPREHHKLDLSQFDPRYFSGDTFEQRVQAAKQAAEQFLNDYKQKVATPLQQVDRAYITSKDVEIEILEPKHVTYIDPNPLIDQLNQSIFAVIAPLETAVTGRGRRTYATEIVVSSYANLVAETIGDIIRSSVLDLVRRHIRKVAPQFSEEELANLDIRLRLTYGVSQGELIRQAAVLAATNCFTVDEIRAILGFDPLTEEQQAEIATRSGKGRVGDFAQTVQDIVRDYIRRREEPEPVTPESRRDKQVT